MATDDDMDTLKQISEYGRAQDLARAAQARAAAYSQSVSRYQKRTEAFKKKAEKFKEKSVKFSERYSPFISQRETRGAVFKTPRPTSERYLSSQYTTYKGGVKQLQAQAKVLSGQLTQIKSTEKGLQAQKRKVDIAYEKAGMLDGTKVTPDYETTLELAGSEVKLGGEGALTIGELYDVAAEHGVSIDAYKTYAGGDKFKMATLTASVADVPKYDFGDPGHFKELEASQPQYKWVKRVGVDSGGIEGVKPYEKPGLFEELRSYSDVLRKKSGEYKVETKITKAGLIGGAYLAGGLAGRWAGGFIYPFVHPIKTVKGMGTLFGGADIIKLDPTFPRARTAWGEAITTFKADPVGTAFEMGGGAKGIKTLTATAGKGFRSVRGLGIRTVGEFVPEELVVTKPVLTGKTQFPMSKKGPRGTLKMFKTSPEIKALGEAEGGYHATGYGWRGTTKTPTGVTRASDVPGTYIAPSLSKHFLRLGPEPTSYSYSLLPKLKLPAVEFVRGKVQRIPKEFRRSKAKALDFMRDPARAEEGLIRLSPDVEFARRGSGVEAEAVAGGLLKRTAQETRKGRVRKLLGAGEYYTKVEGEIVPIRKYDISGMAQAPKTVAGRRFKGYRDPSTVASELTYKPSRSATGDVSRLSGSKIRSSYSAKPSSSYSAYAVTSSSFKSSTRRSVSRPRYTPYSTTGITRTTSTPRRFSTSYYQLVRERRTPAVPSSPSYSYYRRPPPTTRITKLPFIKKVKEKKPKKRKGLKLLGPRPYSYKPSLVGIGLPPVKTKAPKKFTGFEVRRVRI